MGECLPPSLTPLLRHLGLEDLLRAGRPSALLGNRFVWGSLQPGRAPLPRRHPGQRLARRPPRLRGASGGARPRGRRGAGAGGAGSYAATGADGGWRLEVETPDGPRLWRRISSPTPPAGPPIWRGGSARGACATTASSASPPCCEPGAGRGHLHPGRSGPGRLVVLGPPRRRPPGRGLHDRRRSPGPRALRPAGDRRLVERLERDPRDPRPRREPRLRAGRDPRGSCRPRAPVWTRSRETAGWPWATRRRPTIPSPRTASARRWAPASMAGTPSRTSWRATPRKAQPIWMSCREPTAPVWIFRATLCCGGALARAAFWSRRREMGYCMETV